MSTSTGTSPALLWTPDPKRARETWIAGFAPWVREHRGVNVDETDYAHLAASLTLPVASRDSTGR
jgi:hypothetical protein